MSLAFGRAKERLADPEGKELRSTDPGSPQARSVRRTGCVQLCSDLSTNAQAKER